MAHPVALTLLALTLLGCTSRGVHSADSVGESGGESGGEVVTETVDVAVTTVPGRTATTVSWDTPTEATSQVVYSEEGQPEHTLEGVSADGLHHEAKLLGLAGGVTWQVAVHSLGDGVEYTSEPVAVTTEVPPEDLPQLAITVPPTDAVTGFTVTLIVQNPDGVVAILDRQGRYVYWQAVANVSAFRALYDPDSAALLWLTMDGSISTLWRCALDGVPEVVVDDLPRSHHDLTAAPGGGWYVIAFDEREVTLEDGSAATVSGDQLLKIAPDGSDVHAVWSSWDEFPYAGVSMPGAGYPEFPHTNSVIVDPESGDVLLSLYLIDSLVLVDPATGLSRWQLGGDDSDWSIPEGETFSHQHSPAFFNGHDQVALFDNGEETDPAEAAVYDLDWDHMSADRTWVTDDGGGHMNITTGSAVSVGDAGDVLVAWGSDAVLSQVTAAGEDDWRVEWDGDLFGFTARIDDLAGASW